MRTEVQVRSRIGSLSLASFALLLFLIAIGALWRQDGSGAATWFQPDDLVRLSTVTLEPDTARPAVSQEDALKIARSLYDWDLMGGSTEVTAALALATDPDMARSDQPMTKRSVWIIHIDGVEQAVSGPWDPAGKTMLPGRTLRHAYVFIDADTGEHIYTRWSE